MKPDTILQLDDVKFKSFEIPDNIGFGGEQTLAVQKLVGGKRVIDAMGRDDRDLSWSGLFLGKDATDRAKYLDYLRTTGRQINLTWAQFAYSVVIRSFMPDYHRGYEIPYSISCMVVADLTAPVVKLPGAAIDAAIRKDGEYIFSATKSFGDPTLDSLADTLVSAIEAVSSFASAAQSTITSVLAPLKAVQARVTELIGSVGSTISNITTVGGLLPNNPLSKLTSKLTSQVVGYTQLPILLNLQSVVGRMGLNLGSLTGSTKTVTTAGGDLFSLAAKVYGKAEEWTTLARANKISDPQLTGVQTISIPKTPDNNGGVNGA